jgi:hypothetical protein
MSTLSLFMQEHGQAAIREVLVEEVITERGLHEVLITAGIVLADDALVFLDEIDIPLDRNGDTPIPHLHHGHRVHVSRCRHIEVTVNYLERQAQRQFGPSRRVHAVKAWAVHEFGLDHKDAIEHVLQLCDSQERPDSDTPLHTLLRGHHCTLCFDLVPEKRVEG